MRIFPKVPVLLISIACLSMTALSAPPSGAAEEPAPFFLMGSGRLHLHNLRNDRETKVELLNRDGSFNDAAFTEVDRVFGFPTAATGEHISPRLLFMLSYFADLVAPDTTIMIESGYRSPEYNAKIRSGGKNVARTSTHMDGMALDFWIAGVDGKKLWETVRSKNCCGVGHYGGKTIHLDSGRPRFWESATSGTASTEPDYNRHIYLSTDLDRYAATARVRLSLSGISTFGFGVKTAGRIYNAGDRKKPLARIELENENTSDCLMVNDRKSSRFLYTTVPATLPAGRYRVQLEFCRKPFAQMPGEVFSNEIESVGSPPP